MGANNEASPNLGQPDQPRADVSVGPPIEPQGNLGKEGIGGCLLWPLLFLIVQPIAFVYGLLTGFRSLPMVINRIFWPYVIYDLLLLGAIVILLLLFFRKKAILPALFVCFLLVFSVVSGFVADAFWRLPAARVTGRQPLPSHFAMLLQCLILVPYFVLALRVNNTFIRDLDDEEGLDRMVKPIAPPAERLYRWLQSRGKKVIPIAFAFVFLVIVFDVVIDWVVNNIIL